METATIRVWSGVHEAIQSYAKAHDMDASAVASIELMKALFAEKDLPEAAQVAIARDFFDMIGTVLSGSKAELAQWAVKALRSEKSI